MTGPPKIDDFDFDFDVPDIDTVAENKVYLAAVKKAIMGLRNSVKIKGTLAAALTDLYGIINNPTSIIAKLDHYTHARHRDGNVVCKFKTRNCCLLLNIVLLISIYQVYVKSASTPSYRVLLDRQLKIINAVIKDGLKAYGVKGDEREGYKLVRR